MDRIKGKKGKGTRKKEKEATSNVKAEGMGQRARGREPIVLSALVFPLQGIKG